MKNFTGKVAGFDVEIDPDGTCFVYPTSPNVVQLDAMRMQAADHFMQFEQKRDLSREQYRYWEKVRKTEGKE
jgi:hypothetical protein